MYLVKRFYIKVRGRIDPSDLIAIIYYQCLRICIIECAVCVMSWNVTCMFFGWLDTVSLSVFVRAHRTLCDV
jgi:hypothetical protein